LHNNIFILAYSLPYSFDIIYFSKGSRGANGKTLATEGTGGFIHGPVKGRANGGKETPSYISKGADGLDFCAHCFTALTKNAFIWVTNDGVTIIVNGLLVGFSLIVNPSNTQVVGQLLEFTIKVHSTGQAAIGVIGKQQLHNGSSGLDGAVGIRRNLHTFLTGSGTGGKKLVVTLNIDNADSTGGLLIDKFNIMQMQVAEGGDFYVKKFGGFKNGGPFLYMDKFVINKYLHGVLL
jgi:hypothetical protein